MGETETVSGTVSGGRSGPLGYPRSRRDAKWPGLTMELCACLRGEEEARESPSWYVSLSKEGGPLNRTGSFRDRLLELQPYCVTPVATGIAIPLGGPGERRTS